MKKLLLSLALIIGLCAAASAQTIKQDSAGNYYAVKKTAAKGTPTGKTFTDSKGQVYPVLLSTKGRLYYERTAKTSGNVYKVYLTPATTKED